MFCQSTFFAYEEQKPPPQQRQESLREKERHETKSINIDIFLYFITLVLSDSYIGIAHLLLTTMPVLKIYAHTSQQQQASQPAVPFIHCVHYISKKIIGAYLCTCIHGTFDCHKFLGPCVRLSNAFSCGVHTTITILLGHHSGEKKILALAFFGKCFSRKRIFPLHHHHKQAWSSWSAAEAEEQTFFFLSSLPFTSSKIKLDRKNSSFSPFFSSLLFPNYFTGVHISHFLVLSLPCCRTWNESEKHQNYTKIISCRWTQKIYWNTFLTIFPQNR